jgi:hypothetical protein
VFQVLWVAYLWCPTTSPDTLVTAGTFITKNMKSEGEFDHFNRWIEDTVSRGLQRLATNAKDERVIEGMLEISSAALPLPIKAIERVWRWFPFPCTWCF